MYFRLWIITPFYTVNQPPQPLPKIHKQSTFLPETNCRSRISNTQPRTPSRAPSSFYGAPKVTITARAAKRIAVISEFIARMPCEPKRQDKCRQDNRCRGGNPAIKSHPTLGERLPHHVTGMTQAAVEDRVKPTGCRLDCCRGGARRWP